MQNESSNPPAHRRFPRDRRGNFVVMFALAAPVLVLLVGLGLDYLDGLSFKTRWDTAADAAALAAVKNAEQYVKNNAATLSAATLQANAIASGKSAGYKSFNANAGASESTESVTPTVNIAVSGVNYTATVTYTGSVKSFFGGLVGINNLKVGGTAVATASSNTYINYYFVLDVSQSMGVGATTTDMQNLYNRTIANGNGGTDGEPGCVFGCHVAENGQAHSNEYLAHYISPVITLRIDAAKTAMQNVLTSAQNAAGNAGNIQFAIYTMQGDPSEGGYLNMVSDLSSNFSTLSSLTGAIDLANGTSAGVADTDFTNSLSQFQSNVMSSASSGNGATASTPLNYVFIITDGVQDVTTCGNWLGHCVAAIDPTLCTPIKNKATVGVIYTTYLPVYKDNTVANGYDGNYEYTLRYNDTVAASQMPINQLGPNLQSCATSAQWYYEASDGAALNAAMQQLFASTFSALTLTQ